MYMKYSMKLIVLVLTATLICSSCDDFLNMQPTNSANAESAIATPADASVAINGIMRAMSSSSYYGRNFLLYGDAKGGDLTIYAAGRGMDGLYRFDHTPSSGSYSSYWVRGYYCIMQVNNLLENIEKLEASGVDGFSFYKGQALTLRALIYFDLVRLYGLPYNYNKGSYGVPNVIKTLSADAQPTRASVAENYAQIISDLNDGMALLASNKAPQNNYVGYYANVALQARVKLYMEDYDGALAAAKEVIESGKYKPYAPEEWVSSWTKQNASESILEIGMDTESDLGTSSLGFYFIRFKHKTNAMGWFLASNYFLNRLGEDADDVRWGIMDNDEYWVDNNVDRKGACYKYVGSVDFDGDGKETYTAVNIKLIRLSEMYLIAAEAAMHKSTPDKAMASDYLNEIRKRSPNLAPATAATIDDQMILNERSKELYGEGHRFFDMIRMNQTIEFNDDFQGVPVTRREKTIDRTYNKIILPISQDEINANPALEDQQNNGY